MLNKRNYEPCYCPEGLDSNNPANWIRKKYLLDFQNGKQPSYPSNSDLESIISKLVPADPELTNTAVGIYVRIELFEYFGHDWRQVFYFGEEQETINALNLLIEKGYLKVIDEDTLKLVNI